MFEKYKYISINIYFKDRLNIYKSINIYFIDNNSLYLNKNMYIKCDLYNIYIYDHDDDGLLYTHIYI